MPHIAVIGAGVIGVTTAWQLCKLGHRVTLIEREPAICAGASARNGAQLSYSYCDALASPSLLGKLPAILLRRDPAFRINMQIDPAFYAWSLRFLWNCRRTKFEANTRSLLRLAAMTEDLMPEVIREFDLRFDHTAPGKLVLCRSRRDLERAAAGIAFKARFGVVQHLLSRGEAETAEPALRHYRDDFAGAVFSPHDAVGRPPEFCMGLAVGLRQRYGLTVLTGTPVQRLLVRRGRVAGVVLGNGDVLSCDAAVVATGHSEALLPAASRGFGGTWPVQGYSITLPARTPAMTTSITDPGRRMVFARIGDDIRIAGVADIGGRSCAFDPSRLAAMRQEAATAFSGCYDVDDAHAPWTGARPCTPSSQPRTGRTTLPGLFVNMGHGTLGWTLCLGSAAQLGTAVGDEFPRQFASIGKAA